MSNLTEIFDSTSPLLVITGDTETAVRKAVHLSLGKVDKNAEIVFDLESVSEELLHRSEGKSTDTAPQIAAYVVDNDNPGRMDFVHMDNIATQGKSYNISAVIGLITNKNIDDLIAESSGMEKFMLGKAMVVSSDYASTYLV